MKRWNLTGLVWTVLFGLCAAFFLASGIYFQDFGVIFLGVLEGACAWGVFRLEARR